ncbi:YgjV family protein [Butyrivibrio sp. VCB2006]|uniref:YgjV family protein n=1 Tax=Butyrivibrio sp. VCB2006 TaxID=1280679 RepID=UPI000424CEF1|nr:YgjV family protein [Butyrivibrio sp. VCB2006]
MLDKAVLIEAIGYLGSALVLVSFLMASVFKLRVVNTIGSVIFTIYAFIIHSYPTAIMNACLVCINIYYLVKMSNTSKSYDLVKADCNDSLLKYTIDKYRDDIVKIFPGINMDFSKANTGYVVCQDGKPAGVLLGELNDGSIEVLLDYVTPEYRDFSIGQFLFTKLPEDGIKSLTYRGSDKYNRPYLDKTGFVKKDGYYEKTL